MTDHSDKLDQRLAEIAGEATAALKANAPAAFSALADARKALRRIAKRAEEGEFEHVELVQDRGPVLAFAGRLIAETSFETKGPQPVAVTLEVWQTEAGALIAGTYRRRPGSEEESFEGIVVEPSADHQAMRFAVLDAFGWDIRSRSMARKLGWSLVRDVP